MQTLSRLKNILCCLFILLATGVQAQDCTTIGQNPATAFPVCGTKTFTQQSVPQCGNKTIPGPPCNTPGGGTHTDKNPFWYKFTCYTTGTLGFVITPHQGDDDYDWQLFDITGHQPNDVYTNAQLYVSMNWSGDGGVTGASSAGTYLDVCSGPGQPLFSSMATLQQGHQYLLLISHFSNNQIGYDLSFTGGTASITDPNIPHLQQAAYNCGPYTIGIKLNKKIQCSSISANGSEFTLQPAAANILSARGVGCNNGFDTDSLLLQLDKALPIGSYRVTSRNGADGNTFLDACGNTLPIGENMPVTVLPSQPVPMGKISPVPCAPDQLILTFPAPIRCAAVAADGSDFLLTGPSPVRIKGALTNCNADGLTDTVTLLLDRRIIRDGTYTVTLVRGSDGNTVENECHLASPPGGKATFYIDPQPYVPLGKVSPPPCAPDQLTLSFQPAIRCSSVATNGSDFLITGPATVVITGATTTCDANGLTDKITLQLKDRILQAGNYQVKLATGTDGNTVQSECWQETPAGAVQPFTIDPQPQIQLRQIAAVGCAPTTVKIGMSIPVRCASIAADGSDFTISGPTTVRVIGATGDCNSQQLTDSISLQLADKIYLAGTYTVHLAAGRDGNTLQSECWQPATAGLQSIFRTADTVNANFDYTFERNCRITTFHFTHNGQHAVNTWNWQFDDGETATVQNPEKKYYDFGLKQARLTVSNGVCSHTLTKDIELKSAVQALFDVSPGPYCPMDVVTPVNKSTGTIISWKWDYGNGATSTGPLPLQMLYFPTRKEEDYRIRLIVENDAHCLDTAIRTIQAVNNCYIDVPTAFSPNNDGNNDYFYPLNAYKAVELHFAVYNRYGQLVFETTDWRRKWDGTIGGNPAGIGTYVWMLRYTEKESGKHVFRKGTTVLLR
ncbi:gliding motility-associated C-terminal domain-containing protein [Chitinophaga nivalis]|uniref:Gliding motility-associated C-terminal domain-containing protein n=1 Tax=Chitinophaga nivalis TaxID=2991709 RepID=A0ABT3IJJ2_9BACT|nr:gliding motility-associated C-terminal domain-containing protein [Chitinophaga nivalis]MCW3466223.1 gliding motility-associated C-terminal domain-containing protein [Chitinophaga nivalis]MCW3484086.1 gliding motility-associated C-terminal domain-containing protein [Chitinophaga nivalis]